MNIDEQWTVEFLLSVSVSSENPTFAFWSYYIMMVCLLQQFIRATRTANWNLHLLSVEQMIPHFFAYDRVNYSRYLPCYLAEMRNLETSHPAIDKNMKNGDFCVQRQDLATFSQTACDQVIEQTINRHSKTQGGLSGKTRKKGAVNRWILSCHIRGYITNICEIIATAPDTNNEKEKKATFKLEKARNRNRHKQQVDAVIETVQKMINPFQQTDPRLINISSGVIPGEEIEEDLLTAHEKGEHAFKVFKAERLEGNEKSVFYPIKTQTLKTFADSGKLVKCSVKKTENVALKASKTLLTRMLHLGKTDKSSVRETLSHSLVPVPPCLGHYDGSMLKTNKSKLLNAFEFMEMPENHQLAANVVIFDGMAMVQTTNVKGLKTFSDFSLEILHRVVNEALRHGADRADFVLDTYPTESIKNGERQRRAAQGVSTMMIINGSQQLPRQWKKYLSSGLNKNNLADFLFKDWSQQRSRVTLYITHGSLCRVIQSTCDLLTSTVVPELETDHEEADTRLMLHALHASKSHSVVNIKSPDTDVAIIAASVCDQIDADLFITMHQHKCLDLNAVKQCLPSTFLSALIGLHVFTGCDSVSAFSGKGNMKALNLMKLNPEFQEAVANIGKDWVPEEKVFATLEKFVCALYGQAKRADQVNDARYNIFCTGTVNDKSFPPNQDCLKQHVLRANYQAAIHRRCLQANISAPSPVGRGWKVEDGQLVLAWTTGLLAPEKLLSIIS